LIKWIYMAGKWQIYMIAVKFSFAVLMLSYFPLLVNAQVESVFFRSLNMEDGLSQGKVNDIAQDHIGYMWFATDDGLNRYDGYQFKIFRHDPDNPNTLSDIAVGALLEDSTRGKLWIGTENSGLSYYDHQTGNFSNYLLVNDNQDGFHDPVMISALAIDYHGRIWAGSSLNKLYRYDPDNNEVMNIALPYPDSVEDPVRLAEDYVTDITVDPDGRVWVGSVNAGLFLIEPESGELKRHYTVAGEFGYKIPEQLISGLDIRKDSILWVGTRESFFSLNIYTHQYEYLGRSQWQRPDRPFFNIGNIILDPEGVLWIGTIDAGLAMLHIPKS
jgi:ligand-binding sensor domain-containing protein